MADPKIFHWLFILILISGLGISGYYRRKARQTGEVITRSQEGRSKLLLRLLAALPLYGSLLAYSLNPRWVGWAAVPLPDWVRWLGVGLGIIAVVLVWWLFTSIGRNISETVLTNSDQELITHGPYRWVRHPLYSTGALLFAALGLVAANWFIILLAVLALVGFGVFVIPAEEARLIAQFGEAYKEYQAHTGALFPQLRR